MMSVSDSIIRLLTTVFYVTNSYDLTKGRKEENYNFIKPLKKIIVVISIRVSS